MVLGAGDHVEIEEGASIKYEGSNVGIGSYSSLTLTNVDIDVGGNLAIGTLSDMAVKITQASALEGTLIEIMFISTLKMH